ncbi:MAG: hypothetical protein KIS92_02520 [Planctomycetota bacterium]|nr:hypothetical protein [Planctomycetota bacterium]
MTPLAAPVHQRGADLNASSGPLHDTDRWIRTAQTHIVLRWSLLAAEIFLAAAISGLALWGLADLTFDLAPVSHKVVRAIYVLALIAGTGALLALVLKNLPRRGAVALGMESAQPAFQGNLLAAVEALEHPGAVPPAVAELSADRAMRVLLATGSRPVMPRLPWTAVNFWLLAAMAVTLSAAVLFGPDFFRAFMRGLFPFEAVESALALQFEDVRPGKTSAVEGDAPALDAVLSGQAGAVYVQVRDPGGEGAPVERALFRGFEDGREVWKGTLGVLRKDCVYRLVAYESEEAQARRHPRVVSTPWYGVAVRPSAGVRRVAVLIESPGYTGYPDKWYSNPDTVQSLAGATATVLVAAGPAGDLGDGRAEMPGGEQGPLERLYDKEGLTFYRLSFPVKQSGLVRVDLAPGDDRHAGAQAVFALSVVQDLPPSADAVIPADAAPDLHGLPVELRLQDDIGLTGARLVLATLPPEDGGSAEIGGERDIFYEIPIPPGRRELSERWVLPAKGLEPWLAAGFQYQVVAYDGSNPSQLGRSAWRKWVPNRSARSRSEAPGMLDGPRSKAPRSLARPNALGKIPDLSADEVAKLDNPGAGVRPKELQRPNSERLENGNLPDQKPRQPQQKDGQRTRQAGGKGAQGEGYEKPQGMGGKKDAPPKGSGPSGEGGDAQGPPDPKQKPEGGKQGPANGEELGVKPDGKEGEQGLGTQPGGKSPGGGGKPGDRAEGPEGSRGSGAQGPEAGGEGQDPGDLGEAPDPNEPGTDGAGGDGGPAGPGGTSNNGGQGGNGGPKKRDGGKKNGREAGPGGGKMAPPDLQTLARMKGISMEEARAYAQSKGIVNARTDYGAARSGDEKSVAPGGTSAYEVFNGATLAPEPSAKPAKEKGARPAAPAARIDRVDPAYRPIVQGYFQRLHGGAAPAEPSGGK